MKMFVLFFVSIEDFWEQVCHSDCPQRTALLPDLWPILSGVSQVPMTWFLCCFFVFCLNLYNAQLLFNETYWDIVEMIDKCFILFSSIQWNPSKTTQWIRHTWSQKRCGPSQRFIYMKIWRKKLCRVVLKSGGLSSVFYTVEQHTVEPLF